MAFTMQGSEGGSGDQVDREACKTLSDNGKRDVKSLSLEELTEELAGYGEKPFRARQMYEWMHVKLARDFEEMTNLSKAFREQCRQRYHYTALEVEQIQESQLDGTKKFLFRLADGNMVESVLMRYKHGNSVCISSQVGCRMGCRFCASTLDGLERNLLPSEMLDQIYAITRLTGERVSNVVVMGIGEPLDNYDNLLKFIHMLTDENGLHISGRNLTVSTCGIVPRIRELAEEGLQITLALSLHATTDEKRRRLMPVANKYSIGELMDACKYYFDTTGRRLTFEYALVGGVNDTPQDARELAALASDFHCHVNLIPVNPVKERDFVQSEAGKIQDFKIKLEKAGINVTIRRTLGSDIDASCGQLRKKYRDKQKAAKTERIM
ncbi:MAG: 23S rRNA (adenine(2503)-C(2))-methyltransferase RlmN [Butyrivibrio sp.]|nr:23S rRNA (adenine(2503)-C(2))-methyltransferase RlmN [Muribaculum sp.]MCM1553188.1 23S rRNA (adenine(2503)-C(2))-methyltransferase RlmN [Butyrivibrio sp.]